MARLYMHGKEITKEFEILDFKKGIAIMNGKEAKIYVDEYGKMFIRDGQNKIFITDWDLKQHGLIDEELEAEGLISSYEKYSSIVEKIRELEEEDER